MKSTKKQIIQDINQAEDKRFSWVKDLRDLSIAELIEKYAYAEAIVETVREPLVILDGNLRIKTVNKSFLDTFKRTKEETHGKYLYDLNSGEWDIPELRKLLEDILQQSSVFNNFEVTHNFKKIGQKTMLLNARRIILDENKTELILLAIEDITPRKILEQQKDDFINIASHELKTPLASIKPFVQLLEKRLKNSEDKNDQRMIQGISQQVDNMIKLTNRLLDIGRIGEGEGEGEGNKMIHKKKKVINEVVKKAISDIQNTTKKQKIILQEDKKSILASFDFDGIEEVLTNLLTNAIKHAPESKKVNVRISTTKKGVIISVQDFGKGIPKKELPLLFNRFYQTKKKGVQGFGLGLYISSEIIKRHGGSIWAKSELGKGATFYFSLPIYKKK